VGSDVLGHRTCGGSSWQELSAAFEFEVSLRLVGKWPRDGIFIPSAVIFAVWELMAAFE
jgi:hypothetical protein